MCRLISIEPGKPGGSAQHAARFAALPEILQRVRPDRGRSERGRYPRENEEHRRVLPWTEEDAAKFTERHPVGSMARLALGLYLNLGVRKSDVVRIGPRHIRDGVLTNFQPQKTSHKGGKRITVPLFEETKALIAATPVTGTDTYLVTSFGKPFTANGFGNKMRRVVRGSGIAGLRQPRFAQAVPHPAGASGLHRAANCRDLRPQGPARNTTLHG